MGNLLADENSQIKQSLKLHPDVSTSRRIEKSGLEAHTSTFAEFLYFPSHHTCRRHRNRHDTSAQRDSKVEDNKYSHRVIT